MLNRWHLVRSAPGAHTHPDELTGQWQDAPVIDAPASVATVADTADTDDFDWWQRCTFAVDEPTDIHFAGLTFPATVFLDGQRLAQCESMFLPLTIQCGPGDHELVVCFGSMNHWLAKRRPRGRWRSTLVSSPGLRWARTTLIGRAPVYGDIPAPVGIWRPITLSPSRVRTDLTMRTDALTGVVTATGTTTGSVVRLVLRNREGSVLSDTATTAEAGQFSCHGAIDNPQLWWPNGYGPQAMYRATLDVDGVEIAERAVGFRTLDVVDDQTGFRIVVNGTRIFCRGATWAPPDPLRMYAGSSEIRSQIAAFADAGSTMVRVVGGLAYEQDEFWEACSEAGLLVWQDAMLATFDPPAEQGELISRELTSVLRAVSGNPALVVVSGGSETLQQPEMLGLGAHESAMEVIDSLLPAAVREHSDAHYVRASPAPPSGSADLAIRPDTGVAHWFGVGGYLRPIIDVRSAAVKFAAECLAFANPPDPDFVDRHFGSAAAAGHHPDWKAGVPRDRGSSWDFEDIRDFYAHSVFGDDLLMVRRTDPQRYLQLGRLAIAAATHECFAFWRRVESGCGGALVLSGRDMQPGAGWGLLDSEGKSKAALAVLARTWAPVSVLLSDDGLSGIRIDIHNDSAQELSGEIRLIATNSTGTAVDATRRVTVAGASSVTFYDAEVSGHFRDLSHAFRFGPPTADAVEVTVQFDNGVRIRDALVITPRAGQSTTLVRAALTPLTETQWQLELTSEVALRFAEISIAGWRPSDNYFHLAPRTPYTLTLSHCGGREIPAGTITSIDLLTPVAVRTGP